MTDEQRIRRLKAKIVLFRGLIHMMQGFAIEVSVMVPGLKKPPELPSFVDEAIE